MSSNASAIIKKGESYTFSFIAEKDAEESAELSDFVFTESYINAEKQPEKIEPLYVYGYSEFKDDELKILWYSSVEEGTFSVAQSKNNIDYKEIFSAEKTYEYTYGKVDFEENYFKIIQTLSDGRSAESPVFIVKYDKEKGDCEVGLLDSDEDGLPDFFEEAYGTDPMKKDTDEDGLTDYEEIYLTDTDPLVYNSVDESLSDAEADSDGDGLSNRGELDLGTNPLNPDTDGDGLTDGEEVELGTDPLNPDTDGDRIPDGDEIKLKLDPMSDTTDGIKDSERMTEQEIAADSEILSQINTDENPMKVSIELEAAGLAETSLSVGESGYASAISNSAVVGAIPEFTYTSGLSTGEVTVKFTADKSVRKNTVGTYAEDCDELKGIKRLNIFKYFEDTNILLPIETFHDEKTNTVYAKTDCLGTYCVMDLEVWMQNLGVEPASSSEKTETVQVAYGAEKAAETAEDKQLNVVFFLDRRALIDENEFGEMKKVLTDTLKILLDNKITSENPDALLNINVPVVWTQSTSTGYTYYRITSSADIELISNILQQEKPASQKEQTSRKEQTSQKRQISQEDRLDITSTLKHVMEKNLNQSTMFFVITSAQQIAAKWSISSEVRQQLEENSDDIHVTFVSKEMEPARYSYVEKIVEASGGKIIPDFNVEEITNEIYSFLDADEYMIITANNYERVRLDDMLKKDSKTDTDDDQLADWGDEVNIDAIYKVKESLPEDQGGDKDIRKKSYLLMDDMPTIQQFITYYGKDHLYVESGFERFKNSKRPPGMPSSAFEKYFFNTVLNKYHITPIYSDPTQVDSDGDGNSDYDEVKKFFTSPLISNPLIFEKYNYDENGILKEDGEISLLWGISDDYFINGNFLSKAEIIDILAKHGVDEEKAKILYDKCSSFKHDPDVLFSDTSMYSRDMNETLSEWTISNKFDQRVGINPAIILSTWKWESGYGLNNSFGSYYKAPDDFEQQLTICIARYLRDFYYYQYNLIEDNKKSELPMMYGTEKQFSLTPCNAAMYSRAQYNPSNMNELKLWHDTIFYEDW